MKRTVVLTDYEIGLLTAALDSHRYWQLSDQRYRNNGYVHGPGSDDPEARRDIRATEKLEAKLEKLSKGSPAGLGSPPAKRAPP